MQVKILTERGYDEAMLGLSLSYNQPTERMPTVTGKLLKTGRDGEKKFLEFISVWLDITAPRYWWQQFDTYRIGVSRQSESTMHTILRKPLEQGDFAQPIPEVFLGTLNHLIREREFTLVKNLLPEGFLQRRIVCTNYGALVRIFGQRHDHRLAEWQMFCAAIREQAEHPELLPS